MDTTSVTAHAGTNVLIKQTLIEEVIGLRFEPVFDIQIGNVIEIRVIGDDGRVPQGKGNGSDLHINLQHWPTVPPEFGKDSGHSAGCHMVKTANK